LASMQQHAYIPILWLMAWIDPAKVTRSAVQNACSIAGLFLTTECIVADLPGKEGNVPAMASRRWYGWVWAECINSDLS